MNNLDLYRVLTESFSYSYSTIGSETMVDQPYIVEEPPLDDGAEMAAFTAKWIVIGLGLVISNILW